MPVPKGNFYAAGEYVDTFKVAAGSFTTNGTVTLWTPAAATKKFRLKEAHVDILVTTVLAAAAPVVIQLFDDTTAIANLAVLAATAPVNTKLTVTVPFHHGKISATANNALKIGPNVSVTTGVVQVAATVMGTEE